MIVPRLDVGREPLGQSVSTKPERRVQYHTPVPCNLLYYLYSTILYVQ